MESKANLSYFKAVFIGVSVVYQAKNEKRGEFCRRKNMEGVAIWDKPARQLYNVKHQINC